MAIDTAEKRRSVVGIITAATTVGVTPNASKDGEWRQQAGWGYSGILVSEPPEPPAAEDFPYPVMFRRRGRRGR